MDEGEALRRLASARVARMGTVDAESHPHVVPVVFATSGRTLYWAVDQKPKRSPAVRRLDNLRERPTVQLVVDRYEDDWRSLWWIRATGVARLLKAGEERDLALELLAQKYPQYRAEPPQGQVVAIELTRVTGWEAVPGPAG